MDGDWSGRDNTTSVVVVESAPVDEARACIVHVSDSNSTANTTLLEGEELSVGRGDGCDLVIPCSHISRVHACIRRDDAGWSIQDMSSVNGFLVNGIKTRSANLKFGDRVDLGRGELLLYRPYDVDYQRALEAQKLESLGRLASGIAHDFNNVLMAIVGATTCLQDELGQQNELTSTTLSDILTASSRGAGLAKQLLGFSKQGAVSKNSIIVVSDLVDEVTRMVERTFDQKICVHKRIESKATVVADKGQLTQVLMNLCINAGDAMPGGGELHIDVREAAPKEIPSAGLFTCIRVRDTGTGMTPEVRQRIFEPFFSTKGEGRGTGLGMATSYGIVTNYGGSIEIESQLDVGTTMSVYLPAQLATEHPHTGNPDSQTRMIAPAGLGRAILLAEDQDLVRRHTSRILRRLGFSVVEACDGVEAVEAVENAEEPFCLAMLDLQMPRRSGDESCRMIRALDTSLPIVMVSGNVEDPRISSLVETQDVEVLSKPYESEDLNRALIRARMI